MPWNTSRRNFIAGSAGALATPVRNGSAGTPQSAPLVRSAAPPPHLGLPIGPLSLDQMTRDYWGQFDPLAIAKLGPPAQEACYQHKFYKSPLVTQEIVPPFGYITQTLRITPGSLIYGVYLPASSNNAPPLWNTQITDKSGSEDYTLFDQPMPAFFLGNNRWTFLSATGAGPGISSFPYLFPEVYAATGNGLFLVELWETSGQTQRIECVLGVLELVA